MSNVIRSLSVSTVHVPSTFKSEVSDFIVADGEYTTVLYVPSELDESLYTHYLLDIYELAIDEGCTYVMLDSSGDEYNALARYDWE